MPKNSKFSIYAYKQKEGQTIVRKWNYYFDHDQQEGQSDERAKGLLYFEQPQRLREPKVKESKK